MHRQSLSGVELLNGYLNERGLGREELQLQALRDLTQTWDVQPDQSLTL